MNDSELSITWLARLSHSRSIDSLILEVYGETVFYGCLFEKEVADLLNYYDLTKNPVASLVSEPFDTNKQTLSKLLEQIRDRNFLSIDQLKALTDGRDARNELVHRLIATEIVISRADKEKFILKIAALFLRIRKAHKLATDLKISFAAKVGISELGIQEKLMEMKQESK
jgi:hypothetical protein